MSLTSCSIAPCPVELRRRGLRARFRVCAVLTVLSILIPAFAGAHEVLATAAGNLRWDAPAKSVKVTFLGKDAKETAVLVVKKLAVMGTEFSIQSDVSAIVLVCGEIRITFAVPAAGGADGATSRLKLDGSAAPALLFNGSEQSTPIGGVTLATTKLRRLQLRAGKSLKFKLRFKVADATMSGTYFPYLFVSLAGVTKTAVGTVQFTIR